MQDVEGGGDGGDLWIKNLDPVWLLSFGPEPDQGVEF